MGEEHDDQAIASSFDLYAFPVGDELKTQMPESMQGLYKKDNHIQKIRTLSEHFQELQDFKIGSMGLVFRLDKKVLIFRSILTKETPALSDERCGRHVPLCRFFPP